MGRMGVFGLIYVRICVALPMLQLHIITGSVAVLCTSKASIMYVTS